MIRTVVVELWTGAVVVRRLRFDPADQAAHVESMPDWAITANLRRLGVAVPDTPEERRERLRAWPNQADLDAIATAYVASNDGVRPVVRVLEQATLPGRRRGTAGSVP